MTCGVVFLWEDSVKHKYGRSFIHCVGLKVTLAITEFKRSRAASLNALICLENLKQTLKAQSLLIDTLVTAV